MRGFLVGALNLSKSFRAIAFGSCVAALAITWVLPNHNPPWLAFHADGWIATILMLLSVVMLALGRGRLSVPAFALLPCALITVLWLQFAFGKITFFGDAWIASLYLLGFLVAFAIGGYSQENSPGKLGDILFSAVALAALVSLGLQFCQWFSLYSDDLEKSIWVLNVSSARPSGNLGQPNQLATLQILGGLGIGWFCLRGKLSGIVWWLLSLPLVFGIALTQSRTGGLTLLVLALFVWFYRGVWPHRGLVWAVFGLLVAYVSFFAVIDGLNSSGSVIGAFESESSSFVSRAKHETRLDIWRMFLDATLRMPWFGYGWGNVSLAQLSVVLDYPELHGVTFRHSHNLFLDLVLFLGIPLGFAVATAIVWALFRWARGVRNAVEALLLLALLPVGVHSMLELPLHYAYFLLPTGLVAGMLAFSVEKPEFKLQKWAAWGVLLVCGTMLTSTIFDYFHVETAYTAMRFEKARIGTSSNVGEPRVVALTQLRDLIRYSKMIPDGAVPAHTLAWMEEVTSANPSLPNGLRLIRTLVFSGKPDEARRWMRKLCAVVPLEQCALGKAAWIEYQAGNDKLMAVKWP